MPEGDAYVPVIVPKKDGSVGVDQINRELHYLGEAVNALAGRTGPVDVRDAVTVNGNLTTAGDLLPDADDTRDIGSTSLRWKDLNLSGEINLPSDYQINLGDAPGGALGAKVMKIYSPDDPSVVLLEPTNIDDVKETTLQLWRTRTGGQEQYVQAVVGNDTTPAVLESFGFVTKGLRIRDSGQVMGQFLDTDHNSAAFSLNNGTFPVALTQYTGNDAQWVRGQNSEEMTLTATTQDSSSNLLTATGLIMAVVARVTNTITQDSAPPTTLQIGDPSVNGRFVSSTAAPFTTGSTFIGILQWNTAGSASQTADSKVRVRLAGGLGNVSGSIRITVFYMRFIPPTS